jgi:uroporphyrinogen-III synthase
LAHFILEHYPSLYPEQRPPPPLLFLVGETRRDIIPKTLMDEKLDEGKRVRVDELVVYGTGVMESFEQDFVQILADTEGKMRWVVVFSPTGCEAMLRALGLLDQGTGKVRSECRDGSGAGKGIGEEGKETYIATIGPTTRDYLRKEFAFEPHVCAGKPSPEGVDEGIRNFLRNR